MHFGGMVTPSSDLFLFAYPLCTELQLSQGHINNQPKSISNVWIFSFHTRNGFFFGLIFELWISFWKVSIREQCPEAWFWERMAIPKYHHPQLPRKMKFLLKIVMCPSWASMQQPAPIFWQTLHHFFQTGWCELNTLSTIAKAKWDSIVWNTEKGVQHQ